MKQEYIFTEQEEKDWIAWCEYCREQERKYSELHGKPSCFWNPNDFITKEKEVID